MSDHVEDAEHRVGAAPGKFKQQAPGLAPRSRERKCNMTKQTRSTDDTVVKGPAGGPDADHEWIALVPGGGPRRVKEISLLEAATMGYPLAYVSKADLAAALADAPEDP